MPAKPVVFFSLLGCAAVCALAVGGLPAHAKPPLPTVLLYPASASDVPALADLRTRLRLDGVFQVLTYDTESASVQRIAAETSHPEWLVAGAMNDDARLALARALQVSFYIVVSPGQGTDSTHLQLVQTAPPALTYDWHGQNRQFGARAVESQAQAALTPPPSEPGTSSPPSPEPAPSAPLVQTPAVPAPAPEAVPVVKPLPIPVPEVRVTPAPPAPAPPLVVVPFPTVKPAPVPVPTPELAPVVKPLPPVIQPLPAAPAPTAPPPGPQMALLPPRPLTLEPSPDVETPPSPPTPARVVKPQARPEDLAAISSLLNRGDAALDGGDVVGAISDYRQAINGAPLSVVPRLKLAAAYQQGGLTDKALDEARRALEIAPDSLPVQQFLTELDTQNGTSDGAITRYRALIERDPQDPAAHSGLAEALWNGGDLPGAEAEYKSAKKLAPPENHAADAHLAQLYATQARYDDCLAALQESGKNGYALAIKIVCNRADTLSSTIEASRDSFTAGKSTREQFYDAAKKVSAQAQALAGFVAKIPPPAEYKLSQLHRMLSTNLLAQEAATLVTSIETSDAAQAQSVSTLDKEAQTEMLTAQAAEEKLGLWDGKK